MLVIASLLLLFSTNKIYDYYKQAKEISVSSENLYKKAFGEENNSASKEKNETDEYSFNLEELQSENPDIVAWIYSEGTPINHPILQGYSNAEYLRQAVDGSYNIAGSIFLDYRNSPDFSDFISIVYGHNMNNDSMFGTLPEYASQKYYENHKSFNVYTKDKLLVADVIAGFVCDNDCIIYEMTPYNNDHQAFIDMIKENSDFSTEVKFGIDDTYIVLSTCSYEYKNARYILVGKVDR